MAKATGTNGTKRPRGFASMDEDKQRQIASQGGRAAHQKGTAHEFTPEEARQAGRKGGETVSRNRDHMAQIGRRGGETVSRDRDHMAQIGRRGGESAGDDGQEADGGNGTVNNRHDERAGSPSRSTR